VIQYWSIKRQRGTSIVEAIITLVLVAILASGAIFVSSKSAAQQGELRVQEIAVSQIRSALINNGTGGVDICTTPPIVTLPNGEVLTAPYIEVQGCNSTITATVNGADVTVPEPLRISINHASVGGQMVVGGTWVEDGSAAASGTAGSVSEAE